MVNKPIPKIMQSRKTQLTHENYNGISRIQQKPTDLASCREVHHRKRGEGQYSFAKCLIINQDVQVCGVAA